MNLSELIDRWNTPEGRPFMGTLIDWSAYDGDGTEPPKDIGCMCAQGQVLVLTGGWTPSQLNDVKQGDADRATAALLNVSVAHAVLLRHINDTVEGAPSVVLTDPGKILGDQWKIVLAFWLHLDLTSDEDWAAARDAAWDAAGDAAGDAAVDAAGVAAGDAAVDAAWDAAWGGAWASNEIQGARILREQGKPFFFLPLFGFATPEDIPPLPDDYGLIAMEGKGD